MYNLSSGSITGMLVLLLLLWEIQDKMKSEWQMDRNYLH